MVWGNIVRINSTPAASLVVESKNNMMKNLKTHRLLGAFTAILLSGTLAGTGTSTGQNSDGTGGEVLTRGPVHEAFAATVPFDPEPGILVDVPPPAVIDEIPPDQRLEGENVTWIPGYWAWDGDSNDFLWVSGIWRNLPPGRQWVPGYWAQTDGRYQWTSGYWEDAETTEVAYLPKPPRSLEVGPNIAAPSRDVSWMPGSWAWQDDRYAWRAGYWAPVRESWIWVPSYYRWTPRGYVYVDGYWDYVVARRGVLFAPVRFGRNVYSRPGFYYSPTTVISLSIFLNHLFLRPNYGHYYFGDYYASNYRDYGYYPSYSYGAGYRGFDPIYSHYRWENRNDRNWDRQRREYFEYRRDNESARPPRTWAALSSIPEADRRAENVALAEPLDRLASSGDGGRQRFQAVDKKDRERFVSQRQEIGKYARERQQLETREVETSADGSSDRATAALVKVSRSPVVAKQSDRPGKGEAPPERLTPRASEQAKQRGRDREKTDKVEPAKLPEGETKVEPGREKGRPTPREEDGASKSREEDPSSKRKEESRPERRSEREPSTKMKPEPKREVTPEPSQKTDSGRGRKEEPRPAEVREPESKPAPREVESVPPREAEPKTPRKAEPTTPKKVEPSRPAPEPRERIEKKQAPQVQQPSRRVELAPVERQQIERPQQPTRRAEPTPVERQQTQRPQREPQQVRPERIAPKQPQVERAARPETSKGKEEERAKRGKNAE